MFVTQVPAQISTANQGEPLPAGANDLVIASLHSISQVPAAVKSVPTDNADCNNLLLVNIATDETMEGDISNPAFSPDPHGEQRGVPLPSESDSSTSSSSRNGSSSTRSDEDAVEDSDQSDPGAPSPESIPYRSDSSNDEDNVELFDDGQIEVYAGCELNVDEGVLLLMDMFLKNKLEKKTMGSFLKCVLRFLPDENNMPKSQYLLFKYVENLCPPPAEKVHHYCKNCLLYIGLESGNCPLCASECHKFYQLLLSTQLRNWFEEHDLADIIDSYAERIQAEGDGSYRDVVDGAEYKRAKLPGKYDLTLLGHTDGLSVSKSSNASMWPLEFVILEVPPFVRFNFVLISGIWVDDSHPLMNTFLKPCVEELRELYHNGFTWTHPKTNKKETTRIVAPAFCADAPVRAQIQNILVHGGRYCCHTCEQKTVRLPAEPVNPGQKPKPRRRAFTFKEEPSKLRTSERMEAQAKVTRANRLQTGKLVAKKGVKGKSFISRLPNCDISTVVYPEYMHILLGVIKQFIALWFESKGPWSLKEEYRDDVNSFLESIRVPDFLTRIPRSTDCYSKWKANELRSFLLYFSLVILSKYMDEEYLQHWMLFVAGMFLLLQDSVTENDIIKAEVYFNMFLRDFSKLYRPKDFSYNLHNLLHFALTTRRWGVLSCNSAFMFESFNGSLAKCIHGTKNQGKELMNTIRLIQGVQILKSRISTANPTMKRFELKNVIKDFYFTEDQLKILAASNLCRPSVVYYRAFIGREIFTSKVYLRQVKRNNFTVCFNQSSGVKAYGEVLVYFESASNINEKIALVKCFKIDHIRMFHHLEAQFVVQHIIPIKKSDVLQLVPLQNIVCKVIRVGKFVCLRPNKLEVNL